MSRLSLSIIYLLLLTLPFSGCAAIFQQGPKTDLEKNEKGDYLPPVAKQIPTIKNYPEDKYIDNYFWLRDKTNPEVINYLKSENQYTDLVMKHTQPLQDQLFKEMVGRIKENDSSVPEQLGNYFYYTRTEAGKQYKIYCRKYGTTDAAEEIILDPNKLYAGSSYFAIGAYKVSPNNKYLAYSTDTDGSETYTVNIKNLQTGELLPEKITNAYETLEWANDNSTIFYTVLDYANRPYQAYRHKIGTDPKKDTLVYHEKDEAYYLSISKTKNKNYILFNSGSQISADVRYLPADNPTGVLEAIGPRQEGVEYYIENHDSKFYILTNENAPNFKLMITPVNATAKSNWKEIIPHYNTIKIDSIQSFQDFLVVSERENAIKKILIINLSNLELNYVDFPEPVYNVELANNPDYESTTLRFNYESFTTPLSVYDYDMEENTSTLLKQREILGGYNPSDYRSERIYATAQDGTQIPISLVYKIKGFEQNGTHPLHLYAYGSYGVSTDIDFDITRLSLLDRGFAFAYAHIRGGGDLGRDWYENGKFLKKKNTFTDFIACAEHLINEKYTSKDKLVISGGSAGGMLMGAVTNMRPDLFKAVVADVPFVDVINTMMDPTLPLTVIEYDEWGDPNKKEYYDYMKSYSPYDNVGPKAYPNMLVTGGLNDPRVGFWEPAKLVAKIRANNTDNNLILLKTNMGAGHGGASGRYDYLKDLAFQYAFFIDRLGMSGNIDSKTTK
jgi:oligopeptidase B